MQKYLKSMLRCLQSPKGTPKSWWEVKAWEIWAFLQIMYVGHLVSAEGVQIDPKDLEYVQSLKAKTPQTVGEARQLMDWNYYQLHTGFFACCKCNSQGKEKATLGGRPHWEGSWPTTTGSTATETAMTRADKWPQPPRPEQSTGQHPRQWTQLNPVEPKAAPSFVGPNEETLKLKMKD